METLGEALSAKAAEARQIEPTHIGPAGPAFAGEEFAGDWKAAVDHLSSVQDGEISGLLSHPDIGPIDLVWGQYDPAKPNAGAGVTLADVLNDFEKVSTGRLMLPNLVAGVPVQAVVRLSIPPQSGGSFLSPISVRLAWDETVDGKTSRRSLHARLDPVPALALEVFSDWPSNPLVLEQEALLMIARAQKEAARAMERGDIEGTHRLFDRAVGYAQGSPQTASVLSEIAAIGTLREEVDRGNKARVTKLAKARSFFRTHSRSDVLDKQERPKDEP
ncbi:MAG: hypothetical protein ABS79_04115 [Planctomycetes bacterium SCN 63-9]|nr:MAG: hypothetical protein ABS79_04115 [Planctomycetes bacterium SCN 63-9]